MSSSKSLIKNNGKKGGVETVALRKNTVDLTPACIKSGQCTQ